MIESGRHPVAGEQTTIVWDTPAGVVTARANVAAHRVEWVAFENVPAARIEKGLLVEAQPGGWVPVDLVWGGAFYAMLPASDLAESLDPERIDRLIWAGMRVKHATMRETEIVHPFDPQLNGLYGTILTGPPSDEQADGRNIVIFADGEVDRSPCGTGTSARLAALYADGEIAVGETYRHESITGSVFTGSVLRETTFGDLPAVVTEIGGRGFITGSHQFVIEPDDPFADGFLLRGSWAGRV
jgi:proline racemase